MHCLLQSRGLVLKHFLSLEQLKTAVIICGVFGRGLFKNNGLYAVLAALRPTFLQGANRKAVYFTVLTFCTFLRAITGVLHFNIAQKHEHIAGSLGVGRRGGAQAPLEPSFPRASPVNIDSGTVSKTCLVIIYVTFEFVYFFNLGVYNG